MTPPEPNRPPGDAERLPPLDDRHPSELALWAFIEEQLGPEDDHVRTCPTCQQRVDRLADVRERFAQSKRAREMAEVVRVEWDDPPAARPRWRRRWALGLAAATAALVAALGGYYLLLVAPPEDPGLRVKGADLHWVVLRDGKQHEAPDGFAFQAGDRVGVEVRTGHDGWAVLLAFDARGQARVLAGDTPPPFPVRGGRATTLPVSVRLTEPLEPLRFVVVVTWEQPVPEALTTLDHLPPGSVVDSRLVGGR